MALGLDSCRLHSKTQQDNLDMHQQEDPSCMFHPKVIRIYCYTEHLFDKTREGGVGEPRQPRGRRKSHFTVDRFAEIQKKIPINN